MAKHFENGSTQMVRTTMAIPIDIGGGQVAKINLPPGATLAGPVKVLTLPNQQTIAHVTVMAPPGVVEKYVAQAAAESEAGGPPLPKTLPDTMSVPAQPLPPKPPSPPQQTAPSAPANLFEKFTSKSPAASTVNPVNKLTDREKIRSSSSEDNVPLSQLNSHKQQVPSAPIPKKKSVEKKPSVKKPQTGFGAFLEEKKHEILKEHPNLSDKDAHREAKVLWETLDVSRKNHYIRNSEAYKLKKGIITNDHLAGEDKKKIFKKAKESLGSPNYKKTVPEQYQPKPEPTRPKPEPTRPKQEPTRPKQEPIYPKQEPTRPKQESPRPKPEAVRPKSEPTDDTRAPSGYNYPKRNVKRKFFDVSDEDDQDDVDWQMPAEEVKPVIKPNKPPSTMPPLKFKKKSKQPNNNSIASPKHQKAEKMPVNDDIDLPPAFGINDESPSIPSPIHHKAPLLKPSELIKESTPPPPLRKIENVVPPPSSERKANFKPICLHEGCYEEAKTESDRGKYWCSDKCCILYSKIIFNAWIGARKANMID